MTTTPTAALSRPDAVEPAVWRGRAMLLLRPADLSEPHAAAELALDLGADGVFRVDVWPGAAAPDTAPGRTLAGDHRTSAPAFLADLIAAVVELYAQARRGGAA